MCICGEEVSVPGLLLRNTEIYNVVGASKILICHFVSQEGSKYTT